MEWTWATDIQANKFKYNHEKSQSTIGHTDWMRVNKETENSHTAFEVDFASVLIFIDAINRWEYKIHWKNKYFLALKACIRTNPWTQVNCTCQLHLIECDGGGEHIARSCCRHFLVLKSTNANHIIKLQTMNHHDPGI